MQESKKGQKNYYLKKKAEKHTKWEKLKSKIDRF
jgi:hypothetical protein